MKIELSTSKITLFRMFLVATILQIKLDSGRLGVWPSELWDLGEHPRSMR